MSPFTRQIVKTFFANEKIQVLDWLEILHFIVDNVRRNLAKTVYANGQQCIECK